MTLPRVVPDGGGGSVILAEMGTNVLEFSTVSRITGDPKYREKAEKGLRAVHAANPNVSHAAVRRNPLARGGSGTDWGIISAASPAVASP